MKHIKDIVQRRRRARAVGDALHRADPLYGDALAVAARVVIERVAR